MARPPRVGVGVRTAVLYDLDHLNPMHYHCYDRSLQRPSSMSLCLASGQLCRQSRVVNLLLWLSEDILWDFQRIVLRGISGSQARLVALL